MCDGLRLRGALRGLPRRRAEDVEHQGDDEQPDDPCHRSDLIEAAPGGAAPVNYAACASWTVMPIAGRQAFTVRRGSGLRAATGAGPCGLRAARIQVRRRDSASERSCEMRDSE